MSDTERQEQRDERSAMQSLYDAQRELDKMNATLARVTAERDNLADDLRDAQEALRWYHKVMPDFETKLPNWTRPTIREALAAVKQTTTNQNEYESTTLPLRRPS